MCHVLAVPPRRGPGPGAMLAGASQTRSMLGLGPVPRKRRTHGPGKDDPGSSTAGSQGPDLPLLRPGAVQLPAKVEHSRAVHVHMPRCRPALQDKAVNAYHVQL